MPKKIVISGYYGFKNFGDELILSILIRYLKTSEADVTVFSVDTEYTKSYGVNSVQTFNFLRVIQTLIKADVLISGGGSLFQDVTSLKSVIYYAFVLGLAQLFGKKTIIFAQGVGPLNNSISRFLVKNLFRKCDYISVRDENSQKILAGWGINSVLVRDPAFSLESVGRDKENILGVQLRTFAGMGDDFLKDLAESINQSNFVKIKLFSLQKSQDLALLKKFENLLINKKIEIVEENIVEEISTVDTLIAMRFHALVVALKANVKCCAVNYDPKVQTLAQKYAFPLIEFTDEKSEIDNKINNALKVQVVEEDFPWDDLLKFVR